MMLTILSISHTTKISLCHCIPDQQWLVRTHYHNHRTSSSRNMFIRKLSDKALGAS